MNNVNSTETYGENTVSISVWDDGTLAHLDIRISGDYGTISHVQRSMLSRSAATRFWLDDAFEILEANGEVDGWDNLNKSELIAKIDIKAIAEAAMLTK